MNVYRKIDHFLLLHRQKDIAPPVSSSKDHTVKQRKLGNKCKKPRNCEYRNKEGKQKKSDKGYTQENNHPAKALTKKRSSI